MANTEAQTLNFFRHLKTVTLVRTKARTLQQLKI